MARTRLATNGKKQSRQSTEARVRKAAAKRSPEALDLPGVSADRDKELEKYGRELGGLAEERKANDRMVKACKARIDKRLTEAGVHFYRLADGRILEITDKRTVKLAATPKTKKPRKRKTEAKGVQT